MYQFSHKTAKTPFLIPTTVFAVEGDVTLKQNSGHFVANNLHCVLFKYISRTLVELRALKRLGEKQRHMSVFENEEQKERFDEYKERKDREVAIMKKLQTIMEEAERKREVEFYEQEKAEFLEKLRLEEEAKAAGNSSKETNLAAS